MIRDNDYFNSFKESIYNNYPTISVLAENNSVILRGTLRMRDNNNKELDNFLIEIIVPDNFPKEIPVVREIGGKIPMCPERHIDGPHGNACLHFRDAVFLQWNENCTIIDFMKKYVEPFFLWQIEYELTGGENQKKAFEHGVDGAVQFYSEILNTEDKKIILNFVKYLTKKKLKSHWPCYCKSGKSLQNCHQEILLKYRKKIRRKDAGKTLKEFKKIMII